MSEVREIPNFEKNCILNDMSRVVGKNLHLKSEEWKNNLFSGLPKYDNLFNVIENEFDKIIPLWFVKKYKIDDPKKYRIQEIKEWTESDDKKLIEHMNEIAARKISLKEIARQHGRSTASITNRMSKLLLNENIELKEKLKISNLLDSNFPQNQKEKAINFLYSLTNDSLNYYVYDWFNSGKSITYKQVKSLQNCDNRYILMDLVTKYTS